MGLTGKEIQKYLKKSSIVVASTFRKGERRRGGGRERGR